MKNRLKYVWTFRIINESTKQDYTNFKKYIK